MFKSIGWIVVVALLLSMNSAALAAKPIEHTFTFKLPDGATKPNSVNLAGDFNGWSTSANVMREKDGVYSATIKLTPGLHSYKFVIDGSNWIEDPSADIKLEQPDGQGGQNSGIMIGDAVAGASTTKPSDADGHLFQYTPAAGDAKPDSVNLAGDFNGWNTTATPMTEKGGTYSVTVKLPAGVHHYKFVVNGSDWKNDPNSDVQFDEADGNGGKNSGVKIDDGAAAPAQHSDASVPQAEDKRLANAAGGIVFAHEFFFRPSKSDAGGNAGGDSGASPKQVAVAGDFNGWNSNANIMEFSGGAFRTTVPLAEGVHFYKFIVDGNWTMDPNSDQSLEISDGFGGKNSAVLTGPDGRKLPPPQPDAINLTAVGHNPQDPHDCNIVDSSHVRLGIRCQANDVQTVNVLCRGADGNWASSPMYKSESVVGIDHYATIVTAPLVGQPLQYCFELIDGSATVYLCATDGVTSLGGAKSSPFTASMQPAFSTPDWAKHVVWYQIFPERFRNGDTSNDPPNTMKWTSDWWSTLPGESGQMYHDVWKRRYGGDFQGIRAELPYLRSLGITAIYLNPIFKAEDLHKYDTSDYRHVDDTFGFKGDIAQLQGETDDPATWQWTKTDKLFLDFLADAHQQGFKVIIDGVFNHTGKAFYAFQDVVQNGKNSRYADWYKITSWEPLHWQGWGGDKDGALPEFKKDAKLGIVHGPREMLMNISKRWLAPDGDPSRGVDGFRLDAAENVPHSFWIDWHNLVKSIKPDALLDGEIWSIAPSWLAGDQFDCTMNYPFVEAMEPFFVDQKRASTPTEFSRQLGTLLMAYPYQVTLVEQNLLDSHDTDRWASRFVNPDLPFNAKDRIQDNNPDYNKSKPGPVEWTRMMQSLVVQFTYAGAPMIYYGDETGMWSPSDPSDREPMIWKDLEPYDDPQVKFNQPLFDWYQRLIAIRAARPEIQTGFARTILADDADGVVAFGRDLDSHHSCIVVNRSESPHDVTLSFGPADRDVQLTNLLDGSRVVVPTDARPTISGGARVAAEHGVLKLTLQPWGSAILSGDWN